MPYMVTVIVRGTKDDHTVKSPWFDTQAQAQSEMQKIRDAQAQYDASNFDAANAALPDWLIVDVGLLVSASISGSG